MNVLHGIETKPRWHGRGVSGATPLRFLKDVVKFPPTTSRLLRPAPTKEKTPWLQTRS